MAWHTVGLQEVLIECRKDVDCIEETEHGACQHRPHELGKGISNEAVLCGESRPRGCGVDTRKAMGCIPPGRTESPRMRGRTVVLWPGHEGCLVECISHPGSSDKQRDWGLSRVATISHHS